MSEPFIGEIRMFGGNFAPKEWSFCDGQIIPIEQNTALFAVIGTTYGGDGVTNFGLPDLRGRAPMHPGNGPGLTPRLLGEKSGLEQTALQETDVAPGERDAIQVNTGASTSLPNMQPYLCIRFIIALDGVFPQRH